MENKTKAQILALISAVMKRANELLSLNPKVIMIAMDINKFQHNGIYSLSVQTADLSTSPDCNLFHRNQLWFIKDGWLVGLFRHIHTSNIFLRRVLFSLL